MKKNDEIKPKKRYHLYIILFILLIITVILLLIASDVNAINETTLCIESNQTTLFSEDTFLLTINCTPYQPMKSFECGLSFNATTCMVTEVAMGSIFSGYQTYFSNGTIDNENGTISDIYGFILGNGTINSSGALVVLTCSAKTIDTNCTNSICVTRMGITNETTYLNYTLTNLTLQIQPRIQISSITPSNNSESVSIQTNFLNATIHHAKGEVMTASITTQPNVGSQNFSSITNDTISCSINALAYDTNYIWILNYTDSMGMYSKNFTFRTEKQTGSPTIDPPSAGYYPHPAEPVEQENVSINNPPATPSIIQGKKSVERGLNYTLCVQSWDGDNDAFCILVDWGDGSFQVSPLTGTSNETICFSHVWNISGNYTVTIQAKDKQNQTSNSSQIRTVLVTDINQTNESSKTPVFISIESGVVQENNTIFFNASSFLDCPQEKIESVLWDFGDGSKGSGLQIQHNYSEAKDFTVTITLLTKDGEETTKTLSITVPVFSSINTKERIMETNFSWIVIIIGIVLVFCIVSIALIIRFRQRK